MLNFENRITILKTTLGTISDLQVNSYNKIQINKTLKSKTILFCKFHLILIS